MLFLFFPEVSIILVKVNISAVKYRIKASAPWIWGKTPAIKTLTSPRELTTDYGVPLQDSLHRLVGTMPRKWSKQGYTRY